MTSNKCYSLTKNNEVFLIKTRTYFDNSQNLAYAIRLYYNVVFHKNGGCLFWCKHDFCVKFKTDTNKLIINTFGHYCSENSLRDSSHQVVDIVCPVKDMKLGSLILNQLVLWASKMYPEKYFSDLSLSSVDEEDPDNKARRNKLYQNLGFKIEGNKAIGNKASNMTAQNIYFDFTITDLDCKIKIQDQWAHFNRDLQL